MCNLFRRKQTGARDLFKIVAVAFLILGSVAVALADDLAGQASVIDGDTLESHGSRIRLWGIDAPESSQLCRGDDSLQYRCGAKAANDLDSFIARRPVNCQPISLDRYGRTVATCSVGGADLGDWLVRSGLALDWPQYSKRKYDDAQRAAEQVGRGMWAGSYVNPFKTKNETDADGADANHALSICRGKRLECGYECGSIHQGGTCCRHPALDRRAGASEEGVVNSCVRSGEKLHGRHERTFSGRIFPSYRNEGPRLDGRAIGRSRRSVHGGGILEESGRCGSPPDTRPISV
jgi:endonuclease YncB( thermonuclease family)